MNNIIVPTFGNYKKRSDIGKYKIIEDENNDKKKAFWINYKIGVAK